MLEVEELPSLFDADAHALVVCELPQRGVTPEAVTAAVKPTGAAVSVILIGGPPHGPGATEIARAGAEEYLPRPLDRDRCIRAVIRALLKRALSREAQSAPPGALLPAAVEALVRWFEARGRLSSGHARSVAEVAAKLAGYHMLPEHEAEAARLAGALHDLGKLGIRPGVLAKPGSLSAAEWQEVRRHPDTGADMLGSIDALAEVAIYVRHHHERWDGAGYPAGLRNGDIPLVSKIVAVADAYDAMVKPRPYRAWGGPAYAAREFRAHAGKQWDPEVVAGLFVCVPELGG
jgi:HD-GYP domain-containing protein (c-di-GMP phosphodiesterase class II)